MKNVWIEGAVTPLGQRIAESVARHPEVERVVGIEPEVRSTWHSRIEWLPAETDHRVQLATLQEHEIDTVIQCSLAPDRMGIRSPDAQADVIGTLRLGAAIAHAESPVRAWVLLSSSDAYIASEGLPLLHRESDAVHEGEEGELAGLIEAEAYAIDVAHHTPHLNVSILRLQQIVGEGTDGGLARHWLQRFVPAVAGYDPSVQFLAVEDAVDATLFAAANELAGVYNVASRGLLRSSDWSEACGATTLPALPLGAGPFEGIATRLGVPHIASRLVPALRHGHAVDTAKIESAGFKPRFDQQDCAEELALRRG